MSVAIVYLIFITISLHACSARRLGFFGKEETVKGSVQLADHMKVEAMLPAAQRLMNLKEILRAEAETRKLLPLCSHDAATMQPNNFAASEEDKKGNKGKEVILPITEELLQQKTAEVQGQKRRARLMIESPPPNKAEETMVSKENEMGEDIVVMDYAQPHRKPPIHNKEP